MTLSVPSPLNSSQLNDINLEEKFISAAEARLRREALPIVEIPDQSDPQFIAAAEAALDTSSYNDSGQGGMHRWVSTKKIDGFLFKRRIYKNDMAYEDLKMNDQIAMIEKARKICEVKDLYLLYVPKSTLLSTNDCILIQEKLDLEHDWDKQKKLFKWATKEPRLEAYMKEAFRQLIIFICEMKYRDVKYINNPLTRDGRIGLIDLDEKSPGLGGNDDHGLFRAIPLNWYDEFTAIAQSSLHDKDRENCLEEIQEIRAYRTHKKQVKVELREHYIKNGITKSNQLIRNFSDADSLGIKEDVAAFAKMMISTLNGHLERNKIGSPISPNTKRELDFSDTRLPHIGKGGYWQVFDAKNEGLKTLKRLGYIFDYTLHPNHREFSVVF